MTWKRDFPRQLISKQYGKNLSNCGKHTFWSLIWMQYNHDCNGTCLFCVFDFYWNENTVQDEHKYAKAWCSTLLQKPLLIEVSNQSNQVFWSQLSVGNLSLLEQDKKVNQVLQEVRWKNTDNIGDLNFKRTSCCNSETCTMYML